MKKFLRNLAKESLDPAEMSVHRAFCSVCECEGADLLSALQPGYHIEWDETRVGLGQIKFNLVFSMFVYKILLAVIVFDSVPVFYIFVSNDLF